MKWIIKIFLLIVSIACFYSCKKNNGDNQVPQTVVDISLYTSNPSFINISAVGGHVYLTGGVRGILVYRKSSTEFMAYDRNCTYQPSQAAPCATVKVDATNILAVDSCCNSSFSLYDGSVTHGPAAVSLKTYNTTFDGNVLHIFN